MRLSTSNTTATFVRTILSSAVLLAASQSTLAGNVIQNDVPYKLTVNSSNILIISENLTASNGDAVITINAESGGIRLEKGLTLDTTPGPFQEPLKPSSATIYVGESGALEGTLENEGAIQDGVFITGRSTHHTGKAYWSKGQDENNWAGLQGCYTVVGGGVTEAMNDHAVVVDDFSYMDFVVVGSGSELKTSGQGSAAVYVAEDARIGGALPVGSGLTLNTESTERGESDTVFVIEGMLGSSDGRAIDIAGSATGTLHVGSSGVLAGKGDGSSNGAALLVNGTYTGTFDNDGDIKGGIFISGTHIANEGAAYHAQGSVNDPATLSGCYTAVNGGVSRSLNDHAVYLDDNSVTDFVVALGETEDSKSTIESTAPGKSAIYVADGAQLGGFAGLTENDAAIIAKDGGTISATGNNASAISVRGDLIGKVYVENGFITAPSASNYALDFAASNNALNFEQVGDDSKTTGTISASSQHKNDTVAFRGGSYEGETMQNVDHLIVSTITKGIAMSGDFTIPTLTTVELVKQQVFDEDGKPVTDDNDQPVYEINKNALITLGGRLTAMEDGSNIQFKPQTTTEYNLVKEGVRVTVVDPNSMDGGVAGRVTVDSGSYLVEATEYYTEGKLQVNLKARDAAGIKKIVMNSGASERAAEAFSQTVNVVNADTFTNTDKGNKIFAKLNRNDYDVKKLAEQVQPRVAGEVQKSSQSLANTTHNIVFNRIHGLRRGISYGDQFVDGAVWGQMLYQSGTQEKVDGEPGFNNQTWGLTLGADAELDPAVRMGLAVSLINNTVDGDEGSSNNGYGYLATLYNSWNWRGYFVDSMLTMGNSVNDMSKTIDGYRVEANFDVDQWGARVVGGTNWRIGSWTISPQAEFNYGLVKTQDYDEEGDSGFEQKIQSRDYTTWELGGGMKFNGEFWVREGVIRPEMTFMGYYDFASDGAIVESTLLAGGESSPVIGPNRDQFRLHMGFGLGVQLNNRWTLHTGYNYNWKKTYQSHSFSARARYEF